MRLYLMQHGEAVAKGDDPERPLTPRGESDIVAMARFLDGEIAPKVIYHSGKRRAEQTAQLMAEQLPDARIRQVGNISPSDPVRPLLAAIPAWHDDTLLVCHLPFIATLVTLLLGGDESSPLVDFQPGTMVALERTAGGHWWLLWMVRPAMLHN